MFNNNEDLRLTTKVSKKVNNPVSRKNSPKRVVNTENDHTIEMPSAQKKLIRQQAESPKIENVLFHFQTSASPLKVLAEQSPNTPASEKRQRNEAKAPSPQAVIQAISPAVQEILNFIEGANTFTLLYEERYRYLCFGNTWEEGSSCASETLITQLSSLLFSVNAEQLTETLAQNLELKDGFQRSLMSLLKQFAMMEVQRTAANTSLNLKPNEIQNHKHAVSKNYENLESFKAYMEKQVGEVGENLLKNLSSVPFVSIFRALFPLAEPTIQLPAELGQDKIKPFLDQVQRIFKIAFRPQPAPEQNQGHLANRRLGGRKLNF